MQAPDRNSTSNMVFYIVPVLTFMAAKMSSG